MHFAVSRRVSYFDPHETEHHRLGPGDCARPSRVRGRQRSCGQVRRGSSRGSRRQVSEAPHVGERTEKELITAFYDKIAELSPRLLTFNGHSFDLPVYRVAGLRDHRDMSLGCRPQGPVPIWAE
jgi:Predicted 3'-5' exonuclease related to the exonuclease domain of PolB